MFSMVVGAPAGSGDTTQFFWQLYEITNLLNSPGNAQTPSFNWARRYIKRH
jgi:hypothetical protein